MNKIETKTREIAEGVRLIQKEWDRVTQKSAAAPCAFLFFAGNALFFDEHGAQLPELQREGWCGLHGFLERYPDAPVEFHPWRQPPPYRVEREHLPLLIANLRKKRGRRPKR
jgi:hypothetical protein